jgi:Tfp pilus assembly protein PilF
MEGMGILGDMIPIAAPTAESNNNHMWKKSAGLALLAVLIYSNSLSNGFCGDDHAAIESNEDLDRPVSQLFWSSYLMPGYWRPVMTLIHVGIRAMAGPNPFWFHALNTLLHALVVVLLYQLLLDLLDRPKVAFVAALLFAVHPLHTEAVTQAVGLMEILAAGFMLAAWLLHGRGHWIAASACFLLALGSKESAVVLPCLILLTDYAIRRRVELRPYIGYGTMMAVYALLRTKAGGIVGLYAAPVWYNPLAVLSAPLRAANAIRLAWLVLRLHIFPWPLSSDYSPNAVPIIYDWLALAAWIAPAVALLAVWALAARRSSAVLLAGSIYLAGFAITSNVFYAVASNFGERWAYFPSIGFCLLAGLAYEWGSQWLESRRGARSRILARAVLCVIIAAAAVATVVRNTDWKNDGTLIAANVRAYPESGRSQASLGLQLMIKGDLAGAEKHLKIAEGIMPDYPILQRALGSLALRQGNWPGVERHLQIAMRYSNCEPDTAITYAALLVQAGHYPQALAMLNVLSVEAWGDSRVFSNRAVVHYMQQRPDLARADVSTALHLNPANTQAAALLPRLQAAAR